MGSDWMTGWVDDIAWKERTDRCLVKVHQPLDELANKADKVIYSYRDLRDVLASLQRKFGTPPSLALAQSLIVNDDYWARKSAYTMRYESMLADPLAVIGEVGRALDLRETNASRVLSEVTQLSYQADGERNEVYHKENLYHKDHITNGAEGSWKTQLPDQLVADVEHRYGDWLTERGYRLTR